MRNFRITELSHFIFFIQKSIREKVLLIDIREDARNTILKNFNYIHTSRFRKSCDRILRMRRFSFIKLQSHAGDYSRELGEIASRWQYIS